MIKEKTRTICSRRQATELQAILSPSYQVVTPCMDRLDGTSEKRCRLSKSADQHLYSMNRGICADNRSANGGENA